MEPATLPCLMGLQHDIVCLACAAAAKAIASGPFATASANAKAVATCAASPPVASGQHSSNFLSADMTYTAALQRT